MTMTVKDLIEQLSALPPDATVVVDIAIGYSECTSVELLQPQWSGSPVRVAIGVG